MYFTTRKFWTDLAERTVSTFAQAASGVVLAEAFGVFSVNSWQEIAAVGGGAALLAVLKAFAAGRGSETPSPEGSAE